MKTGFALPNIGPVATAEAVVKVAQRAEALAYDSLWTIERLLWPVKPQTPYPVTPDGLLLEQYKYILDPLDTLTFAAAHTKTITLGTSVLDISCRLSRSHLRWASSLLLCELNPCPDRRKSSRAPGSHDEECLGRCFGLTARGRFPKH